MTTYAASRLAARREEGGTRVWELAVAFILPFGQLLSYDLGGTVFGQDIFAVLLLPLLLARPGVPQRLAPTKVFFTMLVVWLLGQIVTDLIRHTETDDIVRGWAKIGFFGMQFLVLWLFLSRRFDLFVAHFFGLGFTLMLHTRQLEGTYAENPWKFGLGLGVVTVAAVVGSQFPVRSPIGRLVAPTLLTLAGGIAIVNGARNVFGTALLAAAFVYVASWLAARPAIARTITPRKFVVFVLVGVLCCQGIVSLYSGLAGSGMLGQDAKIKYESQADADINIIQGGRVESLVSTVAIADSPIIGHGSWARDIYYVRMLAHKLAERGARRIESTEGKSDLIPSHSHLLGAWVEAGIAGAAFWTWVLAICLMGLYEILKIGKAPSPVVVTAAFSMMWDVPFTPFGAEQRFLRAAQITLLLYVIAVARERRKIDRLLNAAHEDRPPAGALP